MAVKKMSQLVIASLVIGLTLLPLAAARKIDTKDNLVSHVEISASNLVLEPPRGRMINQVAVPVQTSKSEQPRFADLTAEFGDNDDKDDKDDESDKAVEEMVRKTLYHMKINSTGNSTTDLENAMSGIFGTIIQEDIALYKAIGAIIQQAIKDQEEYAKAVECLLKEMIKQAHDKAELKQKLEALLKGMFKHKSNGHYDKDFCKVIEELLKHIFKKCPKNEMSAYKDSYFESSCYFKCMKS